MTALHRMGWAGSFLCCLQGVTSLYCGTPGTESLELKQSQKQRQNKPIPAPHPSKYFPEWLCKLFLVQMHLTHTFHIYPLPVHSVHYIAWRILKIYRPTV